MPPSLIGREQPAAVLAAQVAQVLDGRGGLVLVTGEAGIGKTALLAEAARDAAARGARVLNAACWEGDGAPDYWPWVQIVRGLAGAASLPEWSAVSQAAGGSLPVLLGEAGPPAGADNARFQLHDAFASLLVSAARSKPTVLVLDDLHWADSESLRLLDFVVRHTWFEPLLMIGSYRDVEVRAGHRAAAILPPLAARAKTVRLAGLDAAQVGALIERTTGTEPGPDLVEEVHRRTGGNPFFVEQTAQLGSAAVAEASVRDAVRRRLDLLPDDVVAVLATAAVIGREFTERLLSATHAVVSPGAEANALLQPALAARLVGLGSHGYAFTHDLVRESLYSSLDPERRRRAHLAVIRACEASELSPAALARHARLAVPLLPGPEAAEYLLAAAGDACDRLASEEAVRHYRAALDAIGHGPARAGIELALAEQLDRAGDMTAAREVFATVLDTARTSDDAELFARAALGLHRMGNTKRDHDGQIRLMDDALAGLELKGGDDGLRARVLAAASMARTHRGTDPADAQKLGHAAVDLAREHGDAETLGWCLLAHHDAIWTPGREADRIAVLDELTAAARRAANGELESLAAFLRSLALLEQGDAAGHAELDTFTALTERTRLPRHRFLAVSRRGTRAAAQGRFEAARRHMDDARALGERMGEVDRHRVWRDQVWALELLRGNAEEALKIARTTTPGEPFVAVLEGVTAAHRGDADTAARHFPEAEARLKAMPGRFAPMLTVYRAQLAAASGDEAWCAPARRELGPVIDNWAVFSGGMALWGPMSLWAGGIDAAQGRWDDAVAYFEAAAAAADRFGAPPWSVLARARLGQALRERDANGDKQTAETMLAEATAEAARLGMAAALPEVAAGPPAKADHVFRPEGQVWTLRFAGRTVHMKDAKGLHDLRVLLGRPGVEVPAVDLLVPSREAPGPGAFGADPVLDEQARGAYRERLLRLDEDIRRAEARGDEPRATALDEERAALLDELRRTTGLGGRPRRLGDDAERARQTVTARIRDVLRKLRGEHPELHEHLSAAIATGARCAYRPETPIRWTL
ncbi:AAA family ATPase [Glycomyces sp. NPDC046736]|uniref:ATP-binding protein n=1 Tax=Glycomyces sp. NPDC046736 TaxID=3155615 RepID=UPI0033E6B4D8